MALGPGLPIRMVWPSPFWRITSTVPMVPPPPERFSTTADWPQAVCRCAASNRPITSVVPPAAAGTMMRTVSVGRQSAKLTRGKIAAVESAAAPDSTRRREKALLVTNSLPALIFVLQGSVGSAAPSGKRTTWRRQLDRPRSPDAAQRAARAARCSADPGSIDQVGILGPGSAKRYCVPHRVRDTAQALVEAEQLEQRRQVAHLLAGCRRGAADEVEDLAVLQAVIGEPLHLPVLVEIDRDHPLVDDLLVHERDLAFGALRNVVEHLAVQGADGRGRSHHDQHLILARADRNLLERAGRQDVALLKLLAGAPAQRRAHECNGRDGANGAPARGQAGRGGRAGA